MTTLNVDEAALRAAVARYPLVRDVQATAHPPHKLDIRVIQRVPVGVIRANGTTVAVTDDGVLLRGIPTGSLPEISARVPPGGARVGDRKTAAKVAVLAEAPASLRARVDPRDARPATGCRRACATGRCCASATASACARSGSPPSASCATRAPTARPTSTCASLAARRRRPDRAAGRSPRIGHRAERGSGHDRRGHRPPTTDPRRPTRDRSDHRPGRGDDDGAGDRPRRSGGSLTSPSTSDQRFSRPKPSCMT